MVLDVVVRFGGGMTFTGRGPSGFDVPLDAAPEAGGTNSGSRPMELLLNALGGCTGMNVVSILRKMRVSYDRFEIRLVGTRQEGHPKAFTAIALEYQFWGEGLEDQHDKIERSVNLSHEKYCSVAATLNPSVRLTHRVVLNGAAVPREASTPVEP